MSRDPANEIVGDRNRDDVIRQGEIKPVRVTQYELTVHDELFTKRSPKTLKTAWHIFYEHKLCDVYQHLAQLLKIAVTLPITSASAERVQSKLKLVELLFVLHPITNA